MYGLIAWIVMILLSPILIPLGLFIGFTYSWEDTVPSEKDMDYEPKEFN